MLFQSGKQHKDKVTWERLCKIVYAFRYKNYRFQAERVDNTGEMRIAALFNVPDSGWPWPHGLEVEVRTHIVMSGNMSDQKIIERVWEMVRGAEYHEAAEWFTVYGAKPYFPHKVAR